VPSDGNQEAREALKRVAVALKQAGVRFALAGGYAAWAHGAPEPAHDVDFVVAEEDVVRAETVLVEEGLRVEHAPEDWLVKVFTDGAMVDVVHRLSNVPVGSPLLNRADEQDVLSVYMPVLTATDVLVSKMNALNEHKCDYSTLLPVGRALREQVDWERLRRETGGNDFAVALLFLLDRLGITCGPAGSV
jgi:Uncharacterised nucleotidyltransferase